MMLHFPCHGQITLHALLFTGDALIQRCIFNRNGNLRGQRAHGAQMVFSEIAPARVFQVKNAVDLYVRRRA